MLKKISELQQGDIICGKNGEKLEVISYQNGDLFYYNTSKAIFETKHLKHQAQNGDSVRLWEGIKC